jgi:hypothetical protein
MIIIERTNKTQREDEYAADLVYEVTVKILKDRNGRSGVTMTTDQFFKMVRARLLDTSPHVA